MKRLTLISWIAAGSVAIISLAFAASGLVWRLLGHVDVPLPRTTAVQSASAVDLAPIAAFAPFGTAPTPFAESADVVSNHVLQGIILAEPATASQAVIATNGGDGRSYAVGARLPDGALIEAVQIDAVILTTASGKRTLTLPKRLSASQASAQAGVRNLAAAARQSTSRNSQPQTSREVIQEYRRKIADNPKKVLDELGLAQAEQGYLVAETPSSSVLRAGLKPGDRVLRVNGSEIGQIEADRRLFEEVVASGRARVEVQRGGQRVVLSFPLD